MSRLVEDIAREHGWKRCKDNRRAFHAVELIECDCWRREIPPEHRALSSGRLATDHESMARDGRYAAEAQSWHRVMVGLGYRNQRTFDRDLRQAVTAARKAGKLGAR